MGWQEDVPKEHLEWIKSAYRFNDLVEEHCLDELPYGLIAEASAILHRFHDDAMLEDLKAVVYCISQAQRTKKPMRLLEKVDNSESAKWTWFAALKAHRVAMRIASLSGRETAVVESLLKSDQYYIAESVIAIAFDAATKTDCDCED
jgi:hypothetical protein